MTATLNDLPVVNGSLVLPRTGAWSADVELDQVVQLNGAVTLRFGEIELVGSAVRAGDWMGSTRVRLVGGAGGLATELPAKAFRSGSFRIAVVDTLGAAGEALDASSDMAALAGGFAHWVRPAGPAGASLTLLASSLGLDWRVAPSGGVLFAAAAWPNAAIGPYEVLSESPEHDRAELGVEAFELLPGTVLGGRRVSVVEHLVAPDRLRTLAWFQ